MAAFVEFEHVKKTYHMGEVSIDALRDATFSVEQGELCVIVGPSGAGKTTLLNILGGMDTLSAGKISVSCGNSYSPILNAASAMPPSSSVSVSVVSVSSKVTTDTASLRWLYKVG